MQSFPAGCTAKPAIDGAFTVAASAWLPHKGSIYKVQLPTKPLQLASSAGAMTIAHHPNRGHDAAFPDSVYARIAANSNAIADGTRKRSTYLTAGSDLQLPAGVTISAGTPIRIRANAWLIDEGTVQSVSGNVLNLASPSTYPLTAGWGYYLLDQLWMLDEPGEWFYDKTTSTLYAWMPDSRAPSQAVAASVLPVGIDVSNRSNLVIDGLAVRSTGIGIRVRGSTDVKIVNSDISDTADVGIDALSSNRLTIQANAISRTGRDAISGQDDVSPVANGMRVLDNVITDSAVRLQGTVVVSLPADSYAAIRTGPNGLVSRNSITNAAYIGIQASAGSTVSDNLIAGACAVLDDGGAIYALGDKNNSTITNNLILHSVGAVAGKSPEFAYTQAQGIFLDESSSGVTVRGNSVIDADSGLQIHNGNNNVIDGNTFFGNRVNQVWMQESRNVVNPSGDLFGNTMTGNRITVTTPSAKPIYLDTTISGTERFASFDRNQYVDLIYPTVVIDRNPTTRTDLTFAQWQAATLAGVPRGLDAHGSSTSQTKLASVLTSGTNVIPNANPVSDLNGWSSWNLVKPAGVLVREACPAGWCATYTAGASAGLVSLPNFSTVAGNWYRLSVDITTGTDNQAVDMVVRRGGGGSNGYETLSDRTIRFNAGRTWARYTLNFKVTKSIAAGDTVTQDLGARLDIQNIQPGQTIRIANAELVPITPADALTRTEILVNVAASPAQLACPTASTDAAACARFVKLVDNTPVTWPYYLPARSTEVIYTRDARLVDTDGDGIADGQDTCPNTPPGAVVNAAGCALSQR